MAQKRTHLDRPENDVIAPSDSKRYKGSPIISEVLESEAQPPPLIQTSNSKDVRINATTEGEEDDYTSSSGSSSTSSSDDDDDDDEDEKEEEEEEEEEIAYISGRTKPLISQIPTHTSTELLSRISSFLPQLQAANTDLEQRLASGEKVDDMILDDAESEVDDVEGEGEGEGEGERPRQYIEMNLGLGVLTEKRTKAKTGDIKLAIDDFTSESGSEQEDEDEEKPEIDTDEVAEGQVLGELMGLKRQKTNTKPGIQELDEG